MDPNAYYKYSDFGTIGNPRPKEPPQEIPDFEDDGSSASVTYEIGMLSAKRPGVVLALGYGNPLKAVVRAATNAQVTPLYTTGTDDKLRAFTFGGTSKTVSLGKKFDPKLFNNEYAVLKAAEECGARTIICASNVVPTDLLAEECVRRDILLLTQFQRDKTLQMWERVLSPAIGEDVKAFAASLKPIVWRRCSKCGLFDDNRKIAAMGYRCPTCNSLVRLTSDERLALVFDEGSVEEWDEGIPQTNGIGYPEFDDVIERANKRSGYEEGVRTGRASIEGAPVAFGIMESSFMMGSMGHVVGERLARMFEKATKFRLPVVVFSASGGARMQEGLVSLMQMAKVSSAVERHSEAGLLYISVLTDPTTGGVTASFATLGDIILAEPGAIIGFAGRRVIQDTIKQALPDDFQTAEFALEHGLVDAIVDRDELRSTLGLIMRLHMLDNDVVGASNGDSLADDADASEDRLRQIDAYKGEPVVKNAAEDAFEEESEDTATSRISASSNAIANIMGGLTELAGIVEQAVTEQADRANLWWALRNKGVADAPYIKARSNVPGHFGSQKSNHAWDSVQIARNVHRPTSQFYIDAMFDDFIELHGDRAYADDGAIIAGIGRINGQAVTIIAEEKGQDLKSKIARNFGCPLPEGYRKSMRLMRQAEKFGRPIVCLVDTQGAFCGKEAEERGMGNAIAESLALMSGLKVPVVAAVIGEGGSGGALALAVANKVGMQENAVYSVLSPEGFASILWKDGSRAPEAAEVMKMSATDALEMGMIEDVIPEGQAPAHENPDQAAAALWLYVTNALDELSSLTAEELQAQRYERFRKF